MRESKGGREDKRDGERESKRDPGVRINAVRFFRFARIFINIILRNCQRIVSATLACS